MKRVITGIIAIVLISLGSLHYYSPRPLSWHNLSHPQLITYPVPPFNQTRSFRGKTLKKENYTQLNLPQGFIEIGRIPANPQKALDILKKQINLIRLMYQDHKSSYKGALTTTVKCSAQNLPKLVHPIGKSILGGLRYTTNSQLMPIGCSKVEPKYTAQLIGVHCTNELYLIYYYSTDPSASKINVSKFHCEEP